MFLSTSVRSVQHPNAGHNIQQTYEMIVFRVDAQLLTDGKRNEHHQKKRT